MLRLREFLVQVPLPCFVVELLAQTLDILPKIINNFRHI